MLDVIVAFTKSNFLSSLFYLVLGSYEGAKFGHRQVEVF